MEENVKKDSHSLSLSRPIQCAYIGERNGSPLQYSCLRIPWTEETDRPQSMELDTTKQLNHLLTTNVCVYTQTNTHVVVIVQSFRQI